MNFTKTFELDSSKTNRIPAFFSMQGFKSEQTSPNSYKFKRGTVLAAFYTFNVKKCPTTVDVTLLESEGEKLQVIVNYDVSGKGLQIFTSGDRQKIINEIEALEAFAKVK